MSLKILNIVESAYRATVEEQDDTILWLSQSMRAAGADLDILLRGNAVNYAVEGQQAKPVVIGNWTQRHPADVVGQIRGLVDSGVRVYACGMDIRNRGISTNEMLASVVVLSQSGVTRLFESYDRVLAW